MNVLEHASDAFRRVWHSVSSSSATKPTSSRWSGARPITVGPHRVVLVTPKAPITVAPPSRPVWDDRGWTVRAHRDGRVYEGRYHALVNGAMRTPELRGFAGFISEPSYPGAMTVYIADPPGELRAHPKGPCFQLTQPPWFRLHWVRPAGTVDDAILYVERILAEALQARPH